MKKKKSNIQISITFNQYFELLNISEGVYYPLTNLVDKNNFNSIVNRYRLVSGKIFPFPINLDIDKKTAEKLHIKKNYNW